MTGELEEFLYANSWFQEKYAEKIEPRKYPTFKAALNLLMQHNGDLIVETGTIRMIDDWGAGYSTYLFGDFCKRYGKQLITIDNNHMNLAVSADVTREFNDSITYIHGDSINILENFNSVIDLLYLDSMDCDANDLADNTKPQEHQLNELKAAWGYLNHDCIVLLDDCIFKNGGKCKKTRDFLLDNEFTLILDYYQSLWVRES